MGIAQRLAKQSLDEEIWEKVHQGMQQSIYEEKRNLALKLLAQGAAIDFISKVTFLTIADIQQMKREMLVAVE